MMTSHGNFSDLPFFRSVRQWQCFFEAATMSNMSSLSEELQRRGLRGKKNSLVLCCMEPKAILEEVFCVDLDPQKGASS